MKLCQSHSIGLFYNKCICIWYIYTRLDNSRTNENIYPTINQATHTFQVEVSIANSNERVRPGMFARVTLPYGENESVVIPDRAVQKLMGSGDRYVYVYNESDNTVRYSKVELGRRMDTEFEVLSGVKEGEKVVTTGHMRLTNGCQVELVESAN